MVRISRFVIALLCGACLFSIPRILHAQPYLYDRGNGMIYNSWQNVTWLQDSK